MPRRQKPTLVELLIIVAILGILAAVVLPAMEQARRPSRPPPGSVVGAPQTAEESGAFDGQLNTIEVSELSQSRDMESPARVFGVLADLLPIVVPVAILLIVFVRLRRQMSAQR